MGMCSIYPWPIFYISDKKKISAIDILQRSPNKPSYTSEVSKTKYCHRVSRLSKKGWPKHAAHSTHITLQRDHNLRAKNLEDF